MNKTCFVVMAIGEQRYGDTVITVEDLKDKYNHLIKEAILKAYPSLEIVRADEVSLPGTMTTDIITRIMHSDYVIADVSYPNPNVFYELGLRHACKLGTIIIKDKAAPNVPFDIAHLRYIEYENTTSGLKQLSNQLKTYFEHFDRDPTRPDNHFQEYAKLTGYEFPNYEKKISLPPELQMIQGIMESPELIDMLSRQQKGEKIPETDLFKLMFNNPKISEPLLKMMQNSGVNPFEKLLENNN
jgi:hypothetical protein